MQYHCVPASGEPLVQAVRDFSVDGDNILTGGNRVVRLAYPNLAEVDFIPRDAGSSAWTNDDSLSDRLGRTAHVTFKPSSGSAQTEVSYKYNGIDRLVSTDYVVPDVRREIFNPSTPTNYDAFDRFGRTVRQ